ncbi:MAG: DUF6364 family protein [Hydrogenophaga sp.]|nr:DUF6364 family protein [Hydrogenophaga sp.]
MSNLTLSLDDEVVRQARIRAIQEGTSVSAQVRDFLQRYANGERSDTLLPLAASALPPLRVFDGHSGLAAGIDPTSNRSLLDAADELSSR